MFKRSYFICAYFLSWVVFGTVGLGLNAFCAVLLLLPGRERRAPAVREVIRRLFTSWAGWLHATRILIVTWHGPEALPRPAVYVANHPGLIDATILLARLPDAICIFKPAILRNPFLAPAAIMAGYASGDSGVDLIREVADKIAAGHTLLIFPEGTRTEAGRTLNPFKPGFALIARRAGAPVQVLVIRTSSALLPRGEPWWRVPALPVRMDIHVDCRVEVNPDHPAKEVADKVEQIFRARLSGP